MAFPNAKELKKLAETCRKVGIKHFKSQDFEFTLTDEAPVSAYKLAKQEAKASIQTDDVKSDTLSEEELLFWSTGVSIDTQPEGN